MGGGDKDNVKYSSSDVILLDMSLMQENILSIAKRYECLECYKIVGRREAGVEKRVKRLI